MTAIQLRAAGSARAAQTVAQVWSAVDTVPALASLIGPVEQCLPIDEGWRWDLGQRGALGVNVHVTFDVVVTHRPRREIVFEPVGEAARWAAGQGRILVAGDDGEDGDGQSTQIDVALDLDLELPLPRLVASPISRVIEREVQHSVDDFLRRWVDQVGG